MNESENQIATIECPKCNHINPKSTHVCLKCGYDLTTTTEAVENKTETESDVVYCHKCGTINRKRDYICTRCGTPLMYTPNNSQTTASSKSTTKKNPALTVILIIASIIIMMIFPSSSLFIIILAVITLFNRSTRDYGKGLLKTLEIGFLVSCLIFIIIFGACMLGMFGHL